MSQYADPRDLELTPDTHVHLIGVGGSGMQALAQVLVERGLGVSGSDLRGGQASAALEAMGARIHIGHVADQVEGADLVVVSNAVPPGNVERARAEALGIPVILRADLLELLMAGRRRVLISGTHGKTTTTSRVTVALQACGLDPSFAIGGAISGSTGAHHGTGEVFVAEADEAFRSFLRLTPDVAVITNLEMDHHDVYADLDAYRDAFVQFLDRRPAGGLAVLCADDPGTAGLVGDVRAPVLTYGTAADADVRITGVEVTADGGSRFELTQDGTPLGTVVVAVPGRHNVLNAAAAVIAAREVGGDVAAATAGMAQFTGALRRFQRLGRAGGIEVVDDYGHHPTELAATLDAARQANPDGRVVAVFQPHRYSRTQAIGVDLGRALASADLVVVTDVYAAGEEPVDGVTGAMVADAASTAGAEVRYLPQLSGLPDAVLELVAPGDLVLTMGAGDITELGPQLLARLGGAT